MIRYLLINRTYSNYFGAIFWIFVRSKIHAIMSIQRFSFFYILIFSIFLSNHTFAGDLNNHSNYFISTEDFYNPPACSSITIVRQPTSFDAWTAYSGTANNFSVYATSTSGALTYQWERSADNGQTWVNVTASLDAGTTYTGFNAATIYYTNTSGSITALDGFKYRVKITNSSCFTYSNEVTLRVFGPSFFPGLILPSITNYCSSSPLLSVEFKASQNSSITAFAWERRIGSSGAWVTISSINANTLDAGMTYANYNKADLQITGVNVSSQTLQYRCKVTISVVSKNVIQTSGGSTTNSNTNNLVGIYTGISSLAPGTSLNITQMPPSLVSFCGATGTQTISTNATTTSGNLIYQWQRSTNGTAWINLEDDAVFTGTKTSSLTITNPLSIYKDNQLRCKIISDQSNCNNYTSISTIKIGTPPSFSTQPTSSTGSYCQYRTDGGNVFFPVVSGMTGSNSSDFSFQWFRNTSNSVNGATPIDGQTNIGGYIPMDQAGTFYLFLKVTNAAGCSTNSTIVGPYTITPAPVITQQPSLPSSSICAGEPFTMSVSATPPAGGTLSYAWQRNGAGIVGATSATYTVASATTAMAGEYTVRITSSPTNCVTISDPIVLTVTAAPSIATAVTATPTLICTDPNSTSNLSATTSASNVIYWYETASGGTPLGFSNTGQSFNVKPSATKTYYAETRSVKQLSFAFSRQIQTWVVPQGINSIDVDIKGAAGGQGGTDSGQPGGGGGGARATGTITVTPGMKFRFAIGSEGTTGGGCRNPIGVFGGLGGFNAMGYHGGRGGDAGFGGCSGAGGGGGAATVVQLLDASDNVLNTWLLAGGGGGGGAGQFGNGGYGSAFVANQTVSSIIGARGGTMVGDGAGGGGGGGGINGGMGAGPGGESGAPGGYQGQSEIGSLTSQGSTGGEGWFKIKVAGSADLSCPSLTRVPVTVTVSQNASVIITNQPQPILQCGSATSTFSVTATDATSYQWQVSINNGVSWTNITAPTTPAHTGKTYSGFTTGILSVNAFETSASGYLYRCIVSNSCSLETSQSAALNIQNVSISAISTNTSVCTGTAINLTATSAGNSINWYNNNLLEKTVASGVTYTINPIAGTYTYTAEAFVPSGGCVTPVRRTVIVQVTQGNIAGTISGTSLICTTNTSTYTTTGHLLTSGATRAWTSSNNAIATVNSSGVVTGVAAGTATITCTISGGCGGTVIATKQITVVEIPAITIQPSLLNQGYCLNARTGTLSSSATNATNYQWYFTTSNVSNTGGNAVSPNGTSTTVLPLTNSAGDFYYYMSAINAGCSVNSNLSGRVKVLANCTNLDADGDGVPDEYDIDDDNDGIKDTDETCKVTTASSVAMTASTGNAYATAQATNFGTYLPAVTTGVNASTSFSVLGAIQTQTYTFTSAITNPIVAFYGVDFAKEEWYDLNDNPVTLIPLDVSIPTLIYNNVLTV